MHARNRLITAPAAEPVTLQEAKDQLRIVDTAEDTKLALFITAAVAYTQEYLSRVLIEQTWEMILDAFPYGGVIEVDLPPLISVVSIKYMDENDTEQTWDATKYTVDVDQPYNGLIYPAINESYPSTRNYPKAVTIQFVAGYENGGASPPVLADNVPPVIHQAILLLIGHMWENRESTTLAVDVKTIPMGYDALLAMYKLRSF